MGEIRRIATVSPLPLSLYRSQDANLPSQTPSPINLIYLLADSCGDS
jgi:hypothetical protein